MSQIISTRDAFEAGWNARHKAGFVIPPEKESLELSSMGSDDITPDSIYYLYPKKVGRGAAIKAIEKAYLRMRKRGIPADQAWKKMQEATMAYAEAVGKWPPEDRQYIPHPATWYNSERFLDDRKEWDRGGAKKYVSTIKAV